MPERLCHRLFIELVTDADVFSSSTARFYCGNWYNFAIEFLDELFTHCTLSAHRGLRKSTRPHQQSFTKHSLLLLTVSFIAFVIIMFCIKYFIADSFVKIRPQYFISIYGKTTEAVRWNWSIPTGINHMGSILVSSTFAHLKKNAKTWSHFYLQWFIEQFLRYLNVCCFRQKGSLLMLIPCVEMGF